MNQTTNFNDKKFLFKYIFAIFLILSFIFTIHFFTNKAIQTQVNNTNLINLSSKLRYLSQKIALDISKNNIDSKEIQKSIIEFASIKEELKNSLMSEEIKNILNKESIFCKKIYSYLSNAEKFRVKQYEKDRLYVIDNSQEILELLNDFVYKYQEYATSQLENIKNTRNILLALLIIMILLELIFIFLPMNKEIVNKILQLEEVNKNLEKKVNIRTRELQDKLDIIDENVIISETDKKGIITHVSKAFCRISQYSKEELIGRPHNLVRHEDMPQQAFSNVWETIQKGNTWTGEVKNKKKDGSYYWVYSTIAPKIEDGQIIGYLSMRLDITASKDIEELNKNLEKIISKKTEKLNDLNLKLEEKVKEKTQEVVAMVQKEREKDKMMLQQSKMAIMGEMIAMIAHQWRQPLSAIKAINQSIAFKKKLGKLKDDFFEEESNKINNTVDHMSKTIDDFRNFFKQDKEKKIIPFEKLIQNALDFVEHSYANNNIKIDLNLEFKQEIEVLSGEFMQVLMNILNNAKDALIENKENDRVVSIESKLTEKNMILLDIKDNAGGIPQKIINKIFDPYFSTKSKNGTGIGLYMSKIIIDEHLSGELTAFNLEDGAVFRILVPYNIPNKEN
jgi:PAS domain S-box-containing protein